MADLMQAFNSGLSLAQAFSGNDSPAYRKGLSDRADLDARLGKARQITDENMARENLEASYMAAGMSREQARAAATAQRAGFNPRQASGYSGDLQQQSIRDQALNADNWNDRNALLAVLAGKPVQLAGISGQNLINNRYVEGGGGISTTDQGQAAIQANQARAGASNAQAQSSLGRLGIAQQQFNLQQQGNWAPGRNFATGGTKAGSGGSPKLTEGQSKDVVYLTRGGEANKLLDAMQNNLTATGGQQGYRGVADAFLRGLPGVGTGASINALVSPERQQAEQAGQEFLSAVLRKDTGAAITKEEMDQYSRMYLPQAGDSPVTIAQKAQSRQTALNAIRAGLGSAASVVPESTISPPPSGRTIVRTGTSPDGRKVVQFSDGTTDYAN